MKTEKTIAMLEEVRKNTTDPAMKKDLDKKIELLKNDKTINK
jgi:hypothetical protein